MDAVTLAALDSCLGWYGYQQPAAVAAEQYCPTRDVFEGRLSRVLKTCERAGVGDDEAALLVAVLGEIGNNSFDHNLGHWASEPGCFFACFVDPAAGALGWVADRGRGVLRSLRQTVPELTGHQAALDLAFEKVVSGRYPERRGNGLKFVRRVINGSPRRGLVAVSGTGKLDLGGLGDPVAGLRPWPRGDDLGTLAVVEWRFP